MLSAKTPSVNGNVSIPAPLIKIGLHSGPRLGGNPFDECTMPSRKIQTVTDEKSGAVSQIQRFESKQSAEREMKERFM